MNQEQSYVCSCSRFFQTPQYVSYTTFRRHHQYRQQDDWERANYQSVEAGPVALEEVASNEGSSIDIDAVDFDFAGDGASPGAPLPLQGDWQMIHYLDWTNIGTCRSVYYCWPTTRPEPPSTSNT